jgi:hypothetical protein
VTRLAVAVLTVQWMLGVWYLTEASTVGQFVFALFAVVSGIVVTVGLLESAE